MCRVKKFSDFSEFVTLTVFQQIFPMESNMNQVTKELLESKQNSGQQKYPKTREIKQLGRVETGRLQ